MGGAFTTVGVPTLHTRGRRWRSDHPYIASVFGRLTAVFSSSLLRLARPPLPLDGSQCVIVRRFDNHQLTPCSLQRVHHYLVLPSILLAIPIVFYGIASSMGYNLNDLREVMPLPRA
eukprot:scaffold154273_cov37-Tisochrysis_lutea.AAC.5